MAEPRKFVHFHVEPMREIALAVHAIQIAFRGEGLLLAALRRVTNG